MTSRDPPEPNLHFRRLRATIGILLLLGGLPTLASIFGIQFLPSLAWVEASLILSWAVGLPIGVVLPIVMARSLARRMTEWHPVRVIFVLCGGCIMGVMLGKDFVVAGGPMIYSAIFGEPTELQYIVERAEGFSDRKCRNEIKLKNMPFMFDRLCHFSKEFRAQFHSGQTIIVAGRGSYYGVFLASARAANP